MLLFSKGFDVGRLQSPFIQSHYSTSCSARRTVVDSVLYYCGIGVSKHPQEVIERGSLGN